MKRQIKYLLAFLVAAATLFAVSFLRENPIIVRINKGDEAKTIEMQLANLEKHRTHVAIQDMEGKLWFSEYVWGEHGYAKKLKLGALPEGDFLCFVQNKDGLFTQAFKTDLVDLNFFRAADSDESGNQRLLYAGLEKPTLVRITVEGESSIGVQLANVQRQYTELQLNALAESVMFEQNFRGKDAIAESINLEGMNAGNYFLYLRVGNAALIQQVTWEPGAVKLGEQELFDNVPVEKPEDVVL